MGTDGVDDPQSWDDRVNPAGIDAVETVRGETDDDRIYRPDGSTWGYATDGLEAEYTDNMIADETIDYLERFADSDEPFFLAAGFYRPHTPRIAPQKYFDLYELDDIDSPHDAIPEGYRESIVEPVRRLTFERDGQDSLADATDETEAKQALRSYYASISFLDNQIGRVLDALDRTGLREETIVVLHADHGYHNGENYRYHKGTLYEQTLHVPLVIDYPDLDERGVATDALTELVDLYPTLLDLCGESIPDHCAGTSQRAVLEDPATQVRTSALSTQRANERGGSIRTDRYRYTEWHTDDGVVAELYDHRTDPGEYHNRAEDTACEEVRRELADRLRARHQRALFDPLEA
jgi:arylsulfatase A-like enzyme